MKNNCKAILRKIFFLFIIVLFLHPTTVMAENNSVSSKIENLKNSYVGTYWTKNGLPSSNLDDSKYYYGWQCKGFANFIFNELFKNGNIGVYDANKYYIPSPKGAYEIGKIWNFSISETDAVSALLKKGKAGDYIQVRRRGKSYGHSMILVSVNDSGIRVFDCNSDGKCGVRAYTISWNDFVKKNIGVSLYHATNYNDYNNFNLSVNKSGQQPVFNWDTIQGAKYHLKIWKNKVYEGDPYVVYWNETETSKWVALPKGTYQAYVDADNDGKLTKSNEVEFTVESTGLDFGVYVHESQVELQWSGQTASSYNIKIWKDKDTVWDGEPYTTYWGETGNSKWIALPLGSYQAYIDADLGNGNVLMSNVVEFTVGDTGLDFGAYVHESQVELQWSGQTASSYHIKIWKNTVWDGEPYAVYWGETGNSKWIALPVGTYQGYIDADFGNGSLLMSNVVEFTVESTGLDFGAYVHESKVELQWSGQTASSYHIKIWKNTVWDGEPYATYWGETGNSKWIALPLGSYQAYIDADFGDGNLLMSNVVEFTVENTGLDFGAYVHESQVELQWSGQTASSYHIKIWKNTVWDGEPYATYWGETGNSKWISLPAGTYQGYIDADFGNGTLLMSNVVEFTVSAMTPQPSYSNFSISQKIYNLHDKIEFEIDPINVTSMEINIDKEGTGRVITEECNSENGHTLWGIDLGAGEYSAHITVYNDEKWVDTNTVYFSVVAPSYSNLEINKKKIGTSEDVKFNINTSHAEFMVLKIDKDDEGCVYTERCGDSLDGWTVKADTLGAGQYKAHFLVFSTNDYYVETEEIPFSVYQSPEKSKLTCLPGDSYTKTIFQWEKAANTTYYDLRIDAADYATGGNIKNVWQLRTNRCSVWLPAGEYAAHVDSVNEDGAVGGEVIYFTVTEGKGETPIDIGNEVSARILTGKGSYPITNVGNGVKLDSEIKENINQIWKFVRQNNGSYVISNETGNGVLTAQNAAGASVSTAEYQNLDCQKWNVYGDPEDGYILKSVGTGYVLGSGTGSVLGGYALKYSDDQMFQIEKTNGVAIETPVVTVEDLADEGSGNIKVKWNSCQNATNYDILLYGADAKELKKRITDIQDTSYILSLAAGNYYVCVEAKNEQIGGKASSKQVGFTVKEDISACSVTLDTSVFEYDGTEKMPQIRVHDIRGNVLQQSEYNVVYENNTNAGTATVKVTGQNTYLGTKEINFVIKKASQRLSSSVDGKRISDGDAVDLGINAVGNVTYKVEPDNIAQVNANGIITAKTAGNVSVTVEAEGDENHNSAQITVRFVFEHQYDDGVITQKGDCETDGEKTYTCAGCKKSYTEKIKATGHQWDEGTVTKKVSCQEDGEITYTCQKCGNERKEVIPNEGHLGTVEIRNEKEATCTEDGYTGDLYCTECGQQINSGEIIKATGHQHAEIRNAASATCEEEGYTGDTYCTDCKTIISVGETLSKTDHSWDEGQITTPAACTTAGVKTYTCMFCGSTKTEEVPATGHVTKITKFAKDATCKTEGYSGDVYCQDCGILLEEGKALPKADHSWNEGEITTAATCTAEGMKTFTCTVCKETKTEKIPATGHGATEVRNRKEATCAAEGYTGDTCCTVCGEVIGKGEVTAKTAHTWDAGKITKQPTTTENGIKTFTCQSCGLSKTETVAKLEVKKLTPGKTVKSKATNGVYKVLKDGLSVEFTKPVAKKASVKIPDTIKINGITCKVTGIAASAFKNNTSLRTVTIGKNVTSIGTNAFYGCKKLTRVIGGSAVTKIGDKAFYNCSSLTSITIPAGVTKIGKMAFYNCKKLRTITVKTSKLTSRNIGSKAFTGTYAKVTVKVPVKQLKAYKKLFKSKGMNSRAVYKK